MSDFIGKHVLIGITFKNGKGEVVEHVQTHGRIVAVEDKGISVEKADGSGNFGLPPGTQWLKPAPPGDYRLKSTGEVVVNPDFLTQWTLEESRPENLEAYKARGFSPFNPN